MDLILILLALGTIASAFLAHWSYKTRWYDASALDLFEKSPWDRIRLETVPFLVLTFVNAFFLTNKVFGGEPETFLAGVAYFVLAVTLLALPFVLTYRRLHLFSKPDNDRRDREYAMMTHLTSEAFIFANTRDFPGVRPLTHVDPPHQRGRYRFANIHEEARLNCAKYIYRASAIEQAFADPNSFLASPASCLRVARYMKKHFISEDMKQNSPASIAAVLWAYHGYELEVLREARKIQARRFARPTTSLSRSVALSKGGVK